MDINELNERLTTASNEELEILYSMVRSHPQLRDNLKAYEVFLDTDFNLLQKPTFFSTCAHVLNSVDGITVIHKLLAKGYPITGTETAKQEALIMIEYVMNNGTKEDLVHILQYHPDLNVRFTQDCEYSYLQNYEYIIYYAIRWHQDTVATLIEAGASLNVVNSDGDDPLTFAIKHFNELGYNNSLDIPPMMDGGNLGICWNV